MLELRRHAVAAGVRGGASGVAACWGGAAGVDDKLRMLIELSQHQAHVAHLFMHAEAVKHRGDHPAASAAYRAYVQDARAHLQRTFDFNAHVPDSPMDVTAVAQPLVNALLVSADLESSLGHRDAAEALRVEAMAVSREYLGRVGSADAKRARAASLTLEGRFNEAIVALMEARDVLLEAGDAVALLRVAIDIADVWQWLGDYPRALEEIEHARSLIEPLVGDGPVTQNDVLTGLRESITSILAGRGDPGNGANAAQLYRGYVEITFYRGLIAKALRQWDDAQAAFEQVLPNYAANGTGEAIVFQLAQIELGRGELGAALQRAQSIAPVFEQGAYRAKRPVLHRLIAEILHAQGRSSEASALLRDAVVDLTTRFHDPDALWRAQFLQARVLADTDDAMGAMQAYRDAIATVDGLRRAPLGYRLDSTFLADKMELYAQAIAAAAQHGLGAECCAFMDGLKSRTLTAVLGIPGREGDDTDAFDAQFDALSREIDAIEFAAYRDGPTTDEQLRQRQLLDDRARLLERIRISDPRWRALSEPPAFDLAAVGAALAERSQAAISLFYRAPDLTCVLLWRGRARCARCTVSPATAEALGDYARNLLRASPDVFKHDLSGEFGLQASDLIPRALLDAALEADSLVIVPHGVLHLVPWAALTHEGKRLFEYLPVALFPNVGLLAGDRAGGTPRSASVMGVSAYPGLGALGALPTTRLELDDVAGIYGDAGIELRGPYVDGEASEANYAALEQGLGGSGNVLHLSCHGTIVPGEPMNSGLLLSDAKLDAAEIARSRLPFDEAVLSACSTGWRPTEVAGVVLDADEILGIPGAFLEAGAKAVVVSIPKANGAAARDLTAHYHRHRVAGAPPLRAMRSAQQHMLASGTAPGVWAGFALYGY
jgi:tetratricopeptide (TPR) repeat protein